jgi:hypothetical protein
VPNLPVESEGPAGAAGSSSSLEAAKGVSPPSVAVTVPEASVAAAETILTSIISPFWYALAKLRHRGSGELPSMRSRLVEKARDATCPEKIAPARKARSAVLWMGASISPSNHRTDILFPTIG